MVLNFLWILCSLPIITIGPATCALYKVCLKLTEDKTYTVLKCFFEAFKENFKQSLLVGAFSLFAIVLLYADFNYILQVQGFQQKLFIVVAFVTLAVLLIVITYLNGLIVSFNNTLKGHIINSFKLAFVNPLQTILMWLIILFPFIVYFFISPYIIVSVGWMLLLFGVSLPVYLCSLVLIRIFKRFTPQDRR